MDLSLEQPNGFFFVRRVESGSITLMDRQLDHSVLLAPDQVQDWNVADVLALDIADVEQVLALGPEVVILGTGARQVFPAAAIVAAFLRKGIGVEAMDNAAAARTYNLLAGEGRRVVAGFILPG